MVASALASASAFTSSIITGKPASAQTWLMPLPIWPAPITPIFWITGLRSNASASSEAGRTATFIRCAPTRPSVQAAR